MTIRRPRPSMPRPGTNSRRLAVAPVVLLAAALILVGTGGREARAAVMAPGTAGTLTGRSLPVRPASAPPAPVRPGQTRWAVHPSGASTLDARNLFSYANVEPGARITDHIAVTNESQHAQAFAVYASDAYTTKAGAYDLLLPGQRPDGAGAWIRLAENSVDLQPSQRAIIPFTLTVPANQAPGDYSGGIVAQIKVPGGRGDTVYERIGARVYVRVAGPLRPVLGVSGLLTSYQANLNPVSGGTATVNYTISNTGNVRLGYAQRVTVSGWFGSTTVQPPSLAQLLPGNSITVQAKVPDVWPAGPLTAAVTLTAKAVADSTTPPVHVADESSSLLELPWPQLAALVLLALLGLAGWRVMRRRRARLAALLKAAEERGRRADAADPDAAPGVTPEAR